MRHLARCLLATALVALPMLWAAQPATAQLVDLTCPGSATINFSPGVTLISGPQTITGELRGGTALSSALSSASPCTSLTGVSYHGVTGTLRGTGTLACVGGTASGTIDATWDNGDVSTATWTVTALPPVPLVTATVTGGALKGATILFAGGPTGFTGTCGVLGPATSLSGVGIAEFIRL